MVGVPKNARGDVLRPLRPPPAPAGSELTVANTTDQPAHMWVTTRTGLTAELADGSKVRRNGT